MINAILAGIMISFGAMINLTLGGIVGAIFFSFGLFTILNFKYSLFTGKAGLLATKEIEFVDLIGIWINNFTGVILMAILVFSTPLYTTYIIKAQEIVSIRLQNGFFMNVVLGIFCGILMYLAVTGY